MTVEKNETFPLPLFDGKGFFQTYFGFYTSSQTASKQENIQ